ncbi:hypothetical protein NA56DRAFT_225638 [Hyaloscypha hepaticicola]|uniref:Uncharacterized protein n=1 Tax=Hyaloscypha hepaticicola TaxID=2082293 RepID=A0A2J6QLI5_9HELO|nr:hypothetical protein NA56DRAFT_225638 [Hyaloscypha hepaticicola]
MYAAPGFDNPIPATRDANMSFRNRHRFLDEVYNSYRDPSEVPAKILGYIAQAAGLSMEEILA